MEVHEENSLMVLHIINKSCLFSCILYLVRKIQKSNTEIKTYWRKGYAQKSIRENKAKINKKYSNTKIEHVYSCEHKHI